MKHIFRVFALFFSILSLPSPCIAMEAGAGEKAECEAGFSPPLVKRVFQEEREFRQATEKDIRGRFNYINHFLRTHDPDQEQLQRNILVRMEKDLALLALLNQQLAPLSVGTEVRFPLRFNKMIEAIQGARQHLITPDCFFELFERTVPQGYAYDYVPDQVTYLAPNPHSIYGDSKGTFLKIALFYIEQQLLASEPQRFMRSWMAEKSPCYHKTPLPEKLRYQDLIELNSDFSAFSLLLPGDEDCPQGCFLYAHSGYAFGGDATNAQFPMGKKFGPEDCSSSLSRWLFSPRLTTEDAVYGYRYYLPEEGSYIPSGWPETTVGRFFDSLCPVRTFDASHPIQAGFVYAHRSFPETDPTMTTTRGRGGHTGLVVDMSPDKVWIMSYNRSMPDMEGLGLSAVPYDSRFPQKVMFFDPRLPPLEDRYPLFLASLE